MHTKSDSNFSHGATAGRWLLTVTCVFFGFSFIVLGLAELFGFERRANGFGGTLFGLGLGAFLLWGGIRLFRSTRNRSLQRKAELQKRIDAGREPGTRLKICSCFGECPHCASEHTQKCSAIYDAGTTHTSSSGSGGGYSAGGQYVCVTTWNNHTHQTVLAKRCERPSGRFGLLRAIPYSILAGVATAAFPGFVVLIPIFVVLGIRGTIRNFRELPQKRAMWESQWYCHRCDSFFSDGGDDTDLAAFPDVELIHLQSSSDSPVG